MENSDNSYYINKLYPIQDKVLNIISNVESNFYLTGGTALSRFYLNHRYSDDLDFFCNRNKNYKEETNFIINKIIETFPKYNLELSSMDFVRLNIFHGSTSLKIEFINDVGYHSGELINKGFKLDNWKNILSNKICALSRDSAKDYSDIIFLCFNYKFDWNEILSDAKEKDTWINELEVANIISAFDIKRLEDIKWISKSYLEKIKLEHFNLIAKDILQKNKNSLFTNAN